MFTCPQCEKILSSQQRLDYHMSKQVCQKQAIRHECPLCHKTFTSKRSMNYHISKTVCLKRPSNVVLKLKTVPPKDTTCTYKNSPIAPPDPTIVPSNPTITPSNPTIASSNPTIASKTIDGTVHFPIAFGHEDRAKIHSQLGNIMKLIIIKHPFKSIQLLFNRIHNNTKIPEYHNVFINSDRSNYAMISNGKRFKRCLKKTVIDQIIENTRSILNQYAEDHNDQLGDKVIRKYESYQNQLDDDQEFRKELECEIGGLLLDMKTMIAGDEVIRRSPEEDSNDSLVNTKNRYIYFK